MSPDIDLCQSAEQFKSEECKEDDRSCDLRVQVFSLDIITSKTLKVYSNCNCS